MSLTRCRTLILVAPLIANLTGCESSGGPGEKGSTPSVAARATAISNPGSPSAVPTASPSAPGAKSVSQSQLRERAIDQIQQSSRSNDPAVRANAVEAAGRVKGRLKSVVTKGLSDPNLGVRAVAATTIGRAGLKDLAESTRPLLTDESPLVRTSAVFALTKARAAVDPSPLADLLLTGATTRGRAHAAFLLGEIGNTTALPLLRQAMNQPVPGSGIDELKLFQLQLSEAMVKLGDGDMRQSLRAALYPSRPEELEAAALAAQILGEVGDRAAADQLVYLTEYRDPSGNFYPAEVRLAAAASLAKLGVRGGSFIPDTYVNNVNPAVRGQVAFTYGNIGGPAAFSRLEALLNDPVESVRLTAAFAVIRAGDQ